MWDGHVWAQSIAILARSNVVGIMFNFSAKDGVTTIIMSVTLNNI